MEEQLLANRIHCLRYRIQRSFLLRSQARRPPGVTSASSSFPIEGFSRLLVFWFCFVADPPSSFITVLWSSDSMALDFSCFTRFMPLAHFQCGAHLIHFHSDWKKGQKRHFPKILGSLACKTSQKYFFHIQNSVDLLLWINFLRSFIHMDVFNMCCCRFWTPTAYKWLIAISNWTQHCLVIHYERYGNCSHSEGTCWCIPAPTNGVSGICVILVLVVMNHGTIAFLFCVVLQWWLTFLVLIANCILVD